MKTPVTEDIIITKASGDKAIFSTDKLRRSLERSGAGESIVEAVIREVRAHLYTGITTKAIYGLAFSLLRKSSRSVAGKYQMKTAIMELGPSGFPFEKYFAELLNHHGYSTKVNELIAGKCVTHETDVIAEKGNIRAMIECKFHNTRGITCNVKVPLYIHSRFKDVEHTWLAEQHGGSKKYEGWVVTNTRFTSDAVQYGNCAGLKMVGWNYPRKGSLQELIETSGLYPVTCLTTLSRIEKSKILATGMVLCRDLVGQAQLLASLSITDKRIHNILAEVKGIITPVADRNHPGG